MNNHQSKNAALKLLEKLFRDNQTFLILASRPLDWDGLGSGLIVKKYLESLGKQARLFFPRPLNEREKEFHRFLPFFEEIEDCDTREILNARNAEVLMLLDGANLIQFYDDSETANRAPDLRIYDQRIHIDHHLKPEGLGTLTIHDSTVSSVAEIILREIIPESFIDQRIATLGYAAIVGDTGNFRWKFSPKTLQLASFLLNKGARAEEILGRLFRRTREYFGLLAFAIQNTEYRDELGTCFLFLPYGVLQLNKVDKEKLEVLKSAFRNEVAQSIFEYPRGVILYEEKPCRISGSGRGNNALNKISFPQLFAELGGNTGGHFHAASFTVEGEFEKVKRALIDSLRRKLELSE